MISTKYKYADQFLISALTSNKQVNTLLQALIVECHQIKGIVAADTAALLDSIVDELQFIEAESRQTHHSLASLII